MILKYLQTTFVEVTLETEGVTALVQWSLDLRPRGLRSHSSQSRKLCGRWFSKSVPFGLLDKAAGVFGVSLRGLF